MKPEDHVYYSHPYVGEGRVTFAYTIEGRRKDPVRNVRYGVSFCSPLDNFSKKKGREEALEDLKKNPRDTVVPILNDMGFNHCIVRHLAGLCKADASAPHWTRRLRPVYSCVEYADGTLKETFHQNLKAGERPPVFFPKDTHMSF